MGSRPWRPSCQLVLLRRRRWRHLPTDRWRCTASARPALTAIPHGRAPTPSNAFRNFRVATSITATDEARPSDTKIWLPSGDGITPMGRGGVGVPAVGGILIEESGLCARASRTVTTPVVSPLTNATAPSFEKAIALGRPGAFILPTTANEAVETAATSPCSSDVTQTSLPSGVTVTPSGSPPTPTRPTNLA